ncbi:heterokaryon incompatibility protein-domain-containing protein [Chaetomium sp. MPI-CAGE-AT-0009]|nr:heterokaryon incompatibility protein-domain-containing protein [Chaetomium sp. MPI-CAGE-AT-0009]
MRCKTCLNLQYEDSDPGTHSSSIPFKTSYHETLGAVRRSADEGCHFCTMILAGLDSCRRQDEATPLDDTPIKLKLSMQRGWDKIKGTHVKGDGTITVSMAGMPGHIYYKVQPTSEAEDPTHPVVPDATNDTHTGSARTMTLIRSWLTHCQSHHNNTCAPPSLTPLPTRLIDVSPPNNPTGAVLIETATLPPPSPTTTTSRRTYLALSHCWGLHPPLTTTTLTLPTHLHSLPPLPTLPATFHHAILATRALGFRYLWIDSLCILQDSRSDWAREASRMGDYFARCALVLAAADAADSARGMFRVREPWACQPLVGVGMRLPRVGVVSRVNRETGWQWHDWPAGEEVVRVGRVLGWGTGVPAVPGWGAAAGGGGGLGVGPLDGRAWTMQELLLAGRMVRWEGFRVRWVCKGGEACENAPEMREVGEGVVEVAKGLGAGWVRLLGGEGRMREAVNRQELYMDWYRTVEKYTVRAITKQFDILPAVGGLASRFQELVDDRYVAGLWEKDIHQGLLWTVEGPIQPGEQPFRAPSWSWASINLTSIKFDQVPQPKYHGVWAKDWFKVEEITTPLASLNEYGEVDGGMLRVTGYLREVQLAGASVADKVYEIRKNALLDPLTGEALGNVFLDYPRMSTDPPLHIWCLPVLYAGSTGGNLTSVCLAVLPVEGENGEQKLRRIGLAKVTNKKWDHSFFPNGGERRLCLI